VQNSSSLVIKKNQHLLPLNKIKLYLWTLILKPMDKIITLNNKRKQEYKSLSKEEYLPKDVEKSYRSDMYFKNRGEW